MVLVITKVQLNMAMRWQNIREVLQKKGTDHEIQRNESCFSFTKIG